MQYMVAVTMSVASRLIIFTFVMLVVLVVADVAGYGVEHDDGDE